MDWQLAGRQDARFAVRARGGRGLIERPQSAAGGTGIVERGPCAEGDWGDIVPSLPVLVTPRLTLRPFAPADAAEVQRLAGDRAVADATLNIPHPYPDGIAEAWISRHAELFASGDELVLGVVLGRAPGPATLIGAIGLRFAVPHARAELGYWIGVPYWNQGYATEAARAIVAHGFDTIGLHRLVAQHMSRNPASGRVMQKIGLRHEGRLRGHIRRWDAFEDVEVYGLLRDDWIALAASSPAGEPSAG